MRSRTLHRKTLVAAWVALAAALPALAVVSEKKSGSAAQAQELSPKDMAAQMYNAGVDYIEKGDSLEQKAAAEPSEKKRAKLEAKSRRSYENAIKANLEAIELFPDAFEAHSNLGYAYRKTGKYEEGLAAYDRALELEPRYTPAIEYRAEAYLALNRLEDAKAAYMDLFRSDRERAATLGDAMTDWLERRRADAGGLAPDVIEEFAEWLSQRDEIARQTGSLSGTDPGW